MRKRIAIVGAGGFGREVLQVLRDMDPHGRTWDFAGFIAEPQPEPAMLNRIDANWLGSPDDFLSRPTATHYILAIANPQTRRSLVDRMDSAGLVAASLTHPSALVGHDVELAEGSIICAHGQLTTNIRVGRHVHIDRSAMVGHDCVVGSFSTLHPGAVLSGGVTVGDGSMLGTTSCVLPGVTLGRAVIVGAGAVVTKDVPDGTTVAGVPAREIDR